MRDKVKGDVWREDNATNKKIYGAKKKAWMYW